MPLKTNFMVGSDLSIIGFNFKVPFFGGMARPLRGRNWLLLYARSGKCDVWNQSLIGFRKETSKINS